eukprot:scaffold1954_cov268-Pinguiococcus_pyrenoidosus.AAC.78
MGRHLRRSSIARGAGLAAGGRLGRQTSQARPVAAGCLHIFKNFKTGRRGILPAIQLTQWMHPGGQYFKRVPISSSRGRIL